MGVGYSGGRLHLFHSGGFHTECYVVEESVVEKYGLLVHVAHQAAQVAHTVITYVVAVHLDLAAVNIPETRNQIHKRGLAAARLPHERNRGTLFDLQIYIFENLTFLVVAEADVAEADVALLSVLLG